MEGRIERGEEGGEGLREEGRPEGGVEGGRERETDGGRKGGREGEGETRWKRGLVGGLAKRTEGRCESRRAAVAPGVVRWSHEGTAAGRQPGGQQRV